MYVHVYIHWCTFCGVCVCMNMNMYVCPSESYTAHHFWDSSEMDVAGAGSWEYFQECSGCKLISLQVHAYIQSFSFCSLQWNEYSYVNI